MFRCSALCALVLLPSLAAGQEPVKKSSSESAVAVGRASSRDGKSDSSSYRRVIRDGKVVEECGDRALLTEADLDRMVKALEQDLKKQLGARAGQTRTHVRRVVIVNGETLVDEEQVDGRPVRSGARPVDLDRLLEELERELPREARDPLRRVVRSTAPARATARARATRGTGDLELPEDLRAELEAIGRGLRPDAPEPPPRLRPVRTRHADRAKASRGFRVVRPVRRPPERSAGGR